MNGYLDERVVSLKFDNKQFEKNANDSLNTIDKLKNSLNFKGAVKGLEDVGTDADRLNHSLGNTAQLVQAVSNKFNILDVVAINVISRITNKVLDLGERLATSLSVDQLASGWSKYESKISSVQTIMAATASTWEESARAIGFAGSQMEYVSELLDKLNWFSDETSYSFADMTNNIGKFTSSGIALDKAVEAMEGISVWAAKSGQNAQTATRAYYNLAQAISAGSVKLIDWRSIDNVNMSTIEFKQTAFDTAVAMGTLKKVNDNTFKSLKGNEVTIKDFNSSLKDEWFTSEVLMETLREYGKATTKLSEISDEYGVTATEFLIGLDAYNEGNDKISYIADELGINMEELIPLFEELNSEEYKLSLSAFRAAQEAKTFTEVIEATKDAVSTGWMNTFELIFGNYEETKKLWSEMAEEFYNIFNGGAEGRNTMLDKVMGNSWDKLIKKINEAGISTDKFSERLTENLRESGIPIDSMIEQYGSLQEAIQNVVEIKHHVIEVLNSFTEPIVEGAEAIQTTTERLNEFQKVVNQVIRGEFSSGKARVEKLTEAGWNYATVQGLVNKVWEKNGHTWKDTTITMEDLVEVMSKMTDKELESVGITREQADILAELQKEANETGTELSDLIEKLNKPSGRQLLFESLINVAKAFRKGLEGIRTAWNETFTNQDTVLYRILEGFNKFSKWLVMDEETLDKFTRAMKGVFAIIGMISDAIGEIVNFFFPGFSLGFRTVGGTALDFAANLGDTLVDLRKFVQEGGIVKQVLQYLKDMFFKGAEQVSKWFDSFKQIPIVNSVITTLKTNFSKFFNFVGDLWDTFYDEIKYGSGNLITAFAKVLNKIKDGIKKVYEAYPYLEKLRKIVVKLINMFTDAGKWVFEGLYNGIKNFDYKKLWNAVVDIAKMMVDAFCEFMGIHSPATRWIELAIDCIKGLIIGIAQYTNKAVLAIGNFFRTLFVSIGDQAEDSKISPFQKVKEVVVKTLSAIVEHFGEFFKSVGSSLASIVKFVWSNRLLERAYYAIRAFLNLLLLFNMVRITSVLPETLMSFVKSFRMIAKSVKGYLNSLKIKNYAKIAQSIVLSIGLIALAVNTIARLPKDKSQVAIRALELFESIIIALGLAITSIIAVTNLTSKFATKNPITAIVQIASLIFSISVSVWLLITSLQNLMDILDNNALGSKQNADRLTKGILGILGIVVILLGACTYLSTTLAPGAKAIAAAGFGLIGISAAIWLLLHSVSDFFVNAKSASYIDFSDWETLIRLFEGLLIVAGLIAGLVLAMKAFNGFKFKATIKQSLGVVYILLGMSLAIKILLDGVSNFIESLNKTLAFVDVLFTETDKDGNVIRHIGQAIGYVTFTLVVTLLGIAGYLAILGNIIFRVTSILNKDVNLGQFFGLAVLLISFSAALLTIIHAIDSIYNVLTSMSSWEEGAQYIAALSIVFLSLYGLTVIISKLSKTTGFSAAVTMLSMAAFVGVASYCIYQLAQLPNTVKLIAIASTLTVMLGILTILAGFISGNSTVIKGANSFAFTSATTWKTGLTNMMTILAMSALMWTLGDALAKVAEQPWGKILWAVIMIGIVLGELAVAMVFVSTLGSALKTGSLGVASLAALLLTLGYSLSTIMNALNTEDWSNKLWSAIGAITVLLTLLTIFIGILTVIANIAPGVSIALFQFGLGVAAVVIPIALLIASIAALMAAFTYMVDHLGPIIKFFQTIIDKIKEAYEWMVNLIRKTLDYLGIHSTSDIIADKIENELKTNPEYKDVYEQIMASEGNTFKEKFGNFLNENPEYKDPNYKIKSDKEVAEQEAILKELEEAIKNDASKNETEKERYKGVGYVPVANAPNNATAKAVQKGVSAAYTDPKVQKYYWDYGNRNAKKNQNSQNSVLSSFDLSSYTNTYDMQAMLNEYKSQIPDMSEYKTNMQNTITDSMDGIFAGLPFGDKLAKYINVDDMLGEIDLDIPEIDLGGFDLSSAQLDIESYTDLLGGYTMDLGTYTKTLEEYRQDYSGYKLEDNVMGMINPENIGKKGQKSWKQVLKEYGYSSQEEYIADYEKYLELLQQNVHPDDVSRIRFTSTKVKDAYVDSWIKFNEYLDYIDMQRAEDVSKIVEEYLYLNPDQSFAKEAFAEYMQEHLDVEQVQKEAAQGITTYLDNFISTFYRNVEENLYNYVLEHGGVELLYGSKENAYERTYGPGSRVPFAWEGSFNETTSDFIRKLFDFPEFGANRYRNIDWTSNKEVSKDVIDAIKDGTYKNTQAIDRLDMDIKNLKIVLDTGVLAGALTPKVSKGLANNTMMVLR